MQNVNRSCSLLEIAYFPKWKHNEGMDVEWIREQLDIRSLTQAELAHGIGLTAVQVNKILSGYRQLKAGEADRIRRFFGFILPEDRKSTIAVSGKVGAGDQVELVDDYEKGAGLFHIVRPDWIPGRNVAAAQIDGSSAEPWALNGDIVFWSRTAIAVFEEDLGRPVVAELADGRVMLKRLANGSKPGLWSLLSLNPTHPNIIDTRLVWASRVMAPMPIDQAQIVSHHS